MGLVRKFRTYFSVGVYWYPVLETRDGCGELDEVPEGRRSGCGLKLSLAISRVKFHRHWQNIMPSAFETLGDGAQSGELDVLMPVFAVARIICDAFVAFRDEWWFCS